MEKNILDSRDLSKLFDECIESLKSQRDSTHMYELGNLFAVIAEVKGDLTYYTIPSFMGMLASEIGNFERLISIPLPLLPDPMRKEYENYFKVAIETTVEALRQLKTELCEKSSTDPRQIIEVLGKFGKCFSELYDKRSRAERIIRPTYSPLPPTSES
nr:hypothetical protein [Candidatus Njordarchaeota archaeon]